MRTTKHSVIRVIAGIALLCTPLLAQKKPDFSGTWVAVSPANAVGETQTVTQTATTLTTSHEAEGPEHRSVYKLDGSESRGVLVMHGEDVVTLSKASWTGDVLTITSATTYPDGRKLDSKQVWSLNAEGKLVVAYNQTMSGQPPMAATIVSTKKK